MEPIYSFNQIGDASTSLSTAILDFVDGTDKIGLKDVAASDFHGVLFGWRL